MARHSVWDRRDVHPAWMVIDLLHAERVPCGECRADKGQRCHGTNPTYTYTAPAGVMRSTPAHWVRYATADRTFGRGLPRPHRHAA